ncbi:TPA: protein phosphatase 1, regulatory (inhibitor) subunit 12B-like, partial [Bos taurus]
MAPRSRATRSGPTARSVGGRKQPGSQPQVLSVLGAWGSASLSSLSSAWEAAPRLQLWTWGVWLESTLGNRNSRHRPAADTDFLFVSFLQHERLSRLESGGSDASTERASARARREAREARLATLSSRTEEDGGRDYRKLYESALTENQKLKTKLQEAQLELADVKSKLEKMAQDGLKAETEMLDLSMQSLLSWELPFILTLEGPCLLMAAKADFVLKGLQAGHAGLGCTGQRPGASGWDVDCVAAVEDKLSLCVPGEACGLFSQLLYWSHAPREKPPQCGACAPQLESSLHSSEDPAQPVTEGAEQKGRSERLALRLLRGKAPPFPLARDSREGRER